MDKVYKFTAEEIENIGKMLSEAPAKYVLPVVDYMRQIMAKQDEQGLKKDNV